MEDLENENGAGTAPFPISRGGKSTTPEHNPLIRARSKPTSLRAAINAMCAACMGCTLERIEPGFRAEIRDCSAPHCPLWLRRPYQVKRVDSGQQIHHGDSIVDDAIERAMASRQGAAADDLLDDRPVATTEGVDELRFAAGALQHAAVEGQAETTPREGQFGHRSDLEATFAPGVVPMGEVST